MYIPSTADQFQEYMSSPFRFDKPVKGNRKAKVVEEPVILWKKEYETDPGKFFEKIRNISDYMLFNESNMFNSKNPNKAYLIDAVRGILDTKEYHAAEYTYGVKGMTPIRDNHFFYNAKTFLTGEVIGQPFRFWAKNVSDEYSDRQLLERSKNGARLATNLFVEYAAANGVDLDFAKDKRVNMAGSSDEIYSRLRKQEKLENIIFKLIQNINYNHDLQKIFKDCFDSKFDVNAEFGVIEVINGEVIPKALEPWQVSWISAKEKLETLEDRSVIAASYREYCSFTEIMNEFGMRLNSGTGARGILDAMEALRTGTLTWYNQNEPYFSTYYKSSDVTSDYEWDAQRGNPEYKPDTHIRLNYMNSHFYPFQQTAAGALSYSILKQKIFFKMITPTRYVVEFEGKPINDANWKKWLKNDFNREFIPTFTELGIDEKAPKGKFVVEKPKSELWEATRLGHATLINVGRYEFTATKTGRSNYVGMPICMQISYDKSFALVGYNFAIWTNVAYQRIEEIIGRIGLSSALLVDSSSGIDAGSFLYNAKKTGIAMFNGRGGGGGQLSDKHLEVINLGNDVAEVKNLLSYVGMLDMLYDGMTGASKQARGEAIAYQGAKTTQLNIANQNILKKIKFWEHSLFMNQMLQRMADIAKIVFSRDGMINVNLTKGETEYLRLTRELGTADFDIFLESGFDKAEEKSIINNAVMQVLASGGIDMVEPLIKILLTDNPNEALGIFRQNQEKILQLQAKQQQAAQQQAQIQAQVDAQKNQIPLEQEKIRQETAFGVADRKMAERARSEDFKGNMTDVKNYDDQQDELLKSDLRMTEASHQAALQDGLSERDTLRQPSPANAAQPNQ